MRKKRILLADDHKILRDGIKAIILELPDYEIVGEASDGEEVLKIAKKRKIDVAVVDINMPKLDGIQCTKALKDQHRDIKILAISMHSDEAHIAQMLTAGASGYISKDSGKKVFLEALASVANGEQYFSQQVTQIVMAELTKTKEEKIKENPRKYLTKRELDVLKLIVEEKSNSEIADELFISIRTVDAHRRNLLQKLDVKNVVGLIKFALNNNI